MNEDWQDLAFNHRRIPHGRSKKGGKASGRHGEAVFNPKQAIANYTIYSPKAGAQGYFPKSAGSNERITAELTIHDFTAAPGGYVGSLQNSSGTIRAAIFFAGSRKLLYSIVEAADEVIGADDSDPAGDNKEQDHDRDDEDDEKDDDDGLEESAQESADRFQNERVQAFAKNSFRSPKFWFTWQGEIVADDRTVDSSDLKVRNAPLTRERNIGYIVLHDGGYKGTISCRTLGWKDIEISGRRISGGPVTTPAFKWTDFSIDGENV